MTTLPTGYVLCPNADKCGRAIPVGGVCAVCGPVAASKPKAPNPRPRAGKAAEDALCAALEAAGHEVLTYGEWLRAAIGGVLSPAAVREFPWGLALDPPRKFRSDFAFVRKRLLLEVDGGAHAAGKKKVERDTERRGLAAAAGWRILAVTPAQVRSGKAVELIAEALK